MVARLALDGLGRLLDIGVGPGSIGLMLAPHYAEVVGVDTDADTHPQRSDGRKPVATEVGGESHP